MRKHAKMLQKRLQGNCTRVTQSQPAWLLLMPYRVLAANLMVGVTRDSVRGTPGSSGTFCESKIAREAVLEGLTGGKGLSDSEKDKGMLYKRAKLLPPFPGSRCRTEPDLWEDWWEKAFAIQTTLCCSVIFLAYTIKETAQKDSELYQTLEHLKHTDGSLDAAGLEGFKKLMEKDFAPSGHLMMTRSRDCVRKSFRKF